MRDAQQGFGLQEQQPQPQQAMPTGQYGNMPVPSDGGGTVKVSDVCWRHRLLALSFVVVVVGVGVCWALSFVGVIFCWRRRLLAASLLTARRAQSQEPGAFAYGQIELSVA